MAHINVVVAAVTEDVSTEGFEALIRRRADMVLAGSGIVDLAEAETLLASLPPSEPCALVLRTLPGTLSRTNNARTHEVSNKVEIQEAE